MYFGIAFFLQYTICGNGVLPHLFYRYLISNMFILICLCHIFSAFVNMNRILNPICQLLIQVFLIENDQQAFLFPVLNFVLLCLNWVCTYSRPTEAAQFQFQGSSISILVFREELYFYSHLLWNFCFWKITQEKAMLTLPRINFRDLTKKLRSPLHFCLLSFHL